MQQAARARASAGQHARWCTGRCQHGCEPTSNQVMKVAAVGVREVGAGLLGRLWRGARCLLDYCRGSASCHLHAAAPARARL